MRPRLSSYRRYELRKGLQEAAKVDKALATGVLDSAGDFNFIARGNREEIIAEILQKGATWNMPMPRDEAERLTNQAVRGNKLRRGSRIFWTRRARGDRLLDRKRLGTIGCGRSWP